jgi:hypothetical protein
MDLPDAQRGMAILAEHIQRINAAVRQVRLRPGVGYLLKESSGGTSLVINRGTVGGGGGGGSTIPCPFECIDATEETTMKVQVAWGLIWQRLPTGMLPDDSIPLKLTITDNSFIYSRITFDLNTLLPSAVDFTVETTLKENTSTEQYNLIAVVKVTEGEDKTIASITNICQQPFPSPCSLAPA